MNHLSLITLYHVLAQSPIVYHLLNGRKGQVIQIVNFSVICPLIQRNPVNSITILGFWTFPEDRRLLAVPPPPVTPQSQRRLISSQGGGDGDSSRTEGSSSTEAERVTDVECVRRCYSIGRGTTHSWSLCLISAHFDGLSVPPRPSEATGRPSKVTVSDFLAVYPPTSYPVIV